MSAARSIFAASRMAAVRRTPLITIPRASMIAKNSRMAFTTTSKASDYEVISEKEVPTTTYSPGSGVERTTLVVEDHGAAAAKAATEVVDVVTPLTKAGYAQLTPSLQKMTVFGKVVIITGYVFFHDSSRRFPTLFPPSLFIYYNYNLPTFRTSC